MKPFKFKPLLLAISLSAISHLSYADLNTDRAVIKNDGSEQLNLNANFATAVTGDLYVAIQVGNELLFIANNGSEFSYEVSPYAENQEYSGSFSILDMSAAGIPAGRYSVYQVVAESSTDPLNFTNWVGGLAGLNIINLNIGLSTEVSGDFNGDGFADDDLNKDGFYDDDSNKDGYHDDDKDYDGFHDDDTNKDGLHDDLDPDRAGSHDSTFDDGDRDNNKAKNNGKDQNKNNSKDQNKNNSKDQNKNNSKDKNKNNSKDKNKKSRKLYEDNCSQCHGKDPSKNRSKILKAEKAKKTHSAIKKNKGGMRYLKFLSDGEVQAIADYVKTFK